MKDIVITGNEIISNRTEITGKFFSELEKFKVLSAKEEVEIAEKAVKGCRESLNKLVLHNMRFVVSVSKQYQYSDKITLDDVIGWGLLGCIKAAHNFEPKRGFKFISYAVWWIRQSIITGIKTQKGSIHIPVNQETLINKVVRFIDNYYKEKGEVPSDAEIAEYFYWSVEDVRKIKDFGARSSISSLNKKVKEGELNERIEFLEGSVNVSSDTDENIELKNLIKNELDEREYIIIYSRFFEDPERTYDNIGQLLDLTSERVRQLERGALKKLKRVKEIKNFL